VESRRLVLVLSCGLGVALFALGFLLGRESMRMSQVAEVLPTIAVAPTPSPSPLPPVMPPSPVVAPPPAASAIAPAEKQAVAEYFKVADRLQSADVDDPQAMAASLIGAASEGDTSGLRRLVAQATAALDKARTLTAPPPCGHYHKELVGILTQSRALLQQLEHQVAAGSVESLPTLLTQANGTKARAEALSREERQLKARFGLSR
jgi:hypothetical protein